MAQTEVDEDRRKRLFVVMGKTVSDLRMRLVQANQLVGSLDGHPERATPSLLGRLHDLLAAPQAFDEHGTAEDIEMRRPQGRPLKAPPLNRKSRR